MIDEEPRPMFGPRSPRWPTVREAHLLRHPTCAACGGTKGLEVHHLLPYHRFPEKELDEANLLTLCEHHGCHYAFGHLWNWNGINVDAVLDARKMLAKRERRDSTVYSLGEDFNGRIPNHSGGEAREGDVSVVQGDVLDPMALQSSVASSLPMQDLHGTERCERREGDPYSQGNGIRLEEIGLWFTVGDSGV